MSTLTEAVRDAENAMDALRQTVDGLRATPPDGLTQAEAQALADELEAKVQADAEPAAPPAPPAA